MRLTYIPTITLALAVIVSATGSAPVAAEEATWHFGTSPKHTNITFTSSTDLETIIGHTNVVSGTATTDLAANRVSLVDLTVPVNSLRTGIAMRDEHLRSPMWLDAGSHPAIRFRATSARKADGHNWTIDGILGIHGVEKPTTVTATVRQIPTALAERVGLGAGDWVRVTASLSITLSDFGVAIPEMAAAKVQDSWRIEIAITGSTVAPDNTMDPGDSVSVGGDFNLPATTVADDAPGQHFAFGVGPQMTNISTESKTDVEVIVTHTNVMTGEVAVDLPNGTGAVNLLVPVASLRTGIAMRDEHLRSEYWLDAGRHPHITFMSSKVEKIAYLRYRVTGTFTMHGVGKQLTTEVTMRPVGPAQMKAAGFGNGVQKGLQFNATIQLKLSDFGVRIPSQAAGKVNDELAITFAAVAVEKE